jgi:fatty acid desaturase
MNLTLRDSARGLFRDRDDALANSLVLVVVGVSWLGAFALMASSAWPLDLLGVLICAQSMVLGAYLIHEAAHQTLFARAGANALVGEAMNFLAGGGYASFERIRHMHVRHHLERADLTCFDFKGLMRRHPAVRRLLQALEWTYLPATEVLMHLQLIVRPFAVPSQRKYLPRVLVVLVIRIGLLALLWHWSPRAVLGYFIALGLQLHALNFFDAFHHTFEQYFITPDQKLAAALPNRAYEQANTYSNLVSHRWPWLNLLVLNFCYHNAHHHRPSVVWWRLPALHRRTYGEANPAVLPLRELLSTWHHNRVRRVYAADYGTPRGERRRADSFIGAHGVSFLTVV